MKVNDYISGTKASQYSAEAKNMKDAQEAAKTPPQAEQQSETASGDKVRISGRSREIVRIRETVSAAPEVRMDKVADIKARLEAGTYDVQASLVADALLKGTIDETV